MDRDATAWTVIGTAVAILAIGSSFRSLRDDIAELRVQGDDIRKEMGQLRERMATSRACSKACVRPSRSAWREPR